MQAVSREQMAALDKISSELGVGVETLMENAGEQVARLAEKMAGAGPKGAHSNLRLRFGVLCGHGNNGGDGLCAARKLAERGFMATAFLASPPEKFSGEPLRQLERAERAGVKISGADRIAELHSFDLIIDALLGFNLKGAPKKKFAELIRAANASKRPILAVDIPSGLDADSGEAFEPCIRATATLTLALPKKGLLEKKARKFVGRLFLADIGIPAQAFERLSLTPPEFKEKIVGLA